MRSNTPMPSARAAANLSMNLVTSERINRIDNAKDMQEKNWLKDFMLLLLNRTFTRTQSLSQDERSK